MGSFVLQFNQDTTTTTNYPKIIAFFKKKSLEKILKPKRNMNYYFRSQNSSSNCGMIARNNDNNIISKNNLQNINKPNVIVNKCQVRTCPYFGQYHQSNSMRQTAV